MQLKDIIHAKKNIIISLRTMVMVHLMTSLQYFIYFQDVVEMMNKIKNRMSKIVVIHNILVFINLG